MMVMLLEYIVFISTHVGLIYANQNLFTKQDLRIENVLSIGTCNIYLGRVCPRTNVTFILYTNENQIDGEQIIFNGESKNLLQSSFNTSLDTKILIHGYNSDMLLGVLHLIKKEYFYKMKLNIIFIDWSYYAKGPCYPAAVWNCRMVGKCTANLIETIRNISNFKVHLIGFSLGSHVAAFASNYLNSKKIERITGLDPALPGFTTIVRDSKLDPTDADFVDVIHTNAFIQGTPEQSGHVDFYFNGGIVQPGCWEGNVLACSHHRAPIYFSESINSVVGFWGWKCSSYLEYLVGRCSENGDHILMGEHIDQKMRGVYIVLTNSHSEFAIGPYTSLIKMILDNYELQSIAMQLLKEF